MGAKRVFSQEQINEILQAEKRAKKKCEIIRIMVLKLRSVDGLKSNDIAKIVSYHPATVDNIIVRYFKNGIEDILGEQRRGGNKRYITAESEAKILDEFSKKAENGHMLTVAEIKAAYEKTIQKAVPDSTIYRMLERHNWRKVMPRSKHPQKASDEAIEAYKKNK